MRKLCEFCIDDGFVCDLFEDKEFLEFLCFEFRVVV